MAWLEVELSLGVRRILAVMLAIWTWMMGFAGFGLLIDGLILHGYVAFLVEPPSSAAVSSALWFSYSVVVLGVLMTVTYGLASLVSHTPLHTHGPGRAVGPLCVSVCLFVPTITWTNAALTCDIKLK